MSIQRTLAPTAAPVSALDLLRGAVVACSPAAARARLELELQAYFGADGIYLLSTGKAALTTALQAMARLRPGRAAVAIPAYTCFSVPAAVVRAGLEPVLVDVDPASLDFDAASLAQVMARPDLLCVVPTHLFGVAANIARIRAFGRRDVWILEDAAQAFGVKDTDGRLLGTSGDAAVFSLGRGKHLTCGSGGVIATRSAELTRECEQLCAALPHAGAVRAARVWLELTLMSLFIRPALFWLPASLPFLGLGETVYSTTYSITDVTATSIGAMRSWRRRLDAANRHRRGMVDGLSRKIARRSAGAPAPLLRFPVVLGDAATRAEALSASRKRGLGVSPMYPTAIHRIAELREQFADQQFPGADILAERLVTLPTHPYTAERDVIALGSLCGDATAVPVTDITAEGALSC